MKEQYVFKIDPNDRISFVDSAWLQFARENDAPELTKENVLGKSVWKFISGSETQTLYKSIFNRLHSEQIRVKIPFRCDSPNLIRFMELDMKGLKNSEIRFAGRLLKTEEREYVPLFDIQVRRSQVKVVICSLCRRIKVGTDEWLETADAVRELELFNNPNPPGLIESVCSLCKTLLTDSYFHN